MYLCVFCSLVFAYNSTPNDDGSKRIQGTWIQTIQETSEGKFLISVKGDGVITTKFDGDKFTEISGNEEAGHGTYSLNLKSQPNEIDLVYAPNPRLPLPLGEKPRSKKFKCIYKIEGENLTICYGLKERPKDFIAKADDFIIEFKRKK